jgi:hypothetical protein
MLIALGRLSSKRMEEKYTLCRIYYAHLKEGWLIFAETLTEPVVRTEYACSPIVIHTRAQLTASPSNFDQLKFAHGHSYNFDILLTEHGETKTKFPSAPPLLP